MADSSTPSDGDPRVVPFRRRRGGASTPLPTGQSGPEDDLAAFARTPEDPNEYRDRMVVNVAALLFVVALIAVALWLTDSISTMRRNEDCVLSGRQGCTPVEFDRNVR